MRYTNLCVEKGNILIKKDNSVTKRITGSKYWHIKQFVVPILIIFKLYKLYRKKKSSIICFVSQYLQVLKHIIIY